MTASSTLFSGLTAVLGTQHGKDAVIAPLLASALGLEVTVLRDFDTDRFGTFTGEVARLRDANETVRMKALAALAEAPHGDFGVASEGSFGPHPQIPFVACGLELVMLTSADGAIAVMGTDLTVETNFASLEVRSWQEVAAFVARAQFPSHAVIVKACAGRAATMASITKGIRDWDTLERTVRALLASDGCATVETDMRAHLNPTRMQSIARATASLVEAARSECPHCHAPGFVVTGVERGLPCESCERPTQRPCAEILMCARCAHLVTRLISGQQTAPAAQCDWCNP